MQEDIFILPWDTKCEIGIEDRTNIEYIFNCKFNPLVDSVFDKTKTTEFFRRFW